MSYQDPTQFRRQTQTPEFGDRSRLWVGCAFLGGAALAAGWAFFPDQAEWLKNQMAGLSPNYRPD